MKKMSMFGTLLFSVFFISSAHSIQETPLNRFLAVEAEMFSDAANIVQKISGGQMIHYYHQSIDQGHENGSIQKYQIVRACEKVGDSMCLTLFFRGLESSHQNFKGAAFLPPKTTFDDHAFSMCGNCPRYFALIFSDDSGNYRGVILTKEIVIF